MSEISTERKEELAAESRAKLEFLQREYWRARNGKQRFIRCPFCAPLTQNLKRRNFIGAPQFCCSLFARAMKAILDRQDEVDKAANAARRACHLMNEAQKMDRAHVN